MIMIVASFMGQHVGAKEDLENRTVLLRIIVQSTPFSERMALKPRKA